jgi:hypothetical protein
MMRLPGLLLAGTVLLAVIPVGFWIVLPVMLIGGIALSVYLQRRLCRQPKDEAIDAEYTVIERR